MTILEYTLLFLGIITPFLILSKKWRTTIVLVIAVVLITHIVINGLRWQMTTIYLLNLINITLLLKNWSYFRGNSFRKALACFFIFFMGIIGFGLSTILPVFDFPSVSGDYKVGSENLHLVTDKEEEITEVEGDKRELMIKVWYPAVVKDEGKEPFLDQGERIGLATKYGLPRKTFHYLNKVGTNTFMSPKVANGRFPVLVFSHGYNSNAFAYYALIEEIVSHGYIVLNINHTYESVGSLFPSGEIKFYDVEFDARHNTGEMAEMIWASMEEFTKATSLEGRSNAIRSTLKEYVAAEINQRWSYDIEMVVKQIADWEKASFLSSHIDTSRIGVFGHSQGGAAAGQALLDNSKIIAGVNIDGAQWGEMVDTFLSQPFLLVSSDWPEDHPNFNEVAYQNSSTSDFYKAKLKNSGHSSFMDIPFLLNFSFINEAGSIDPEEAIKISSRLVVGFFDKYLMQEDVDLLDLSNIKGLEITEQ